MPVNGGVFRRVFMAAKAMGFCGIDPAALTEVAAPHIFKASNWFKVVWINATADPAKMVKI